MREVAIISSVRTAVGKAPRGALKDTRPDDMLGVAIAAAVARVPGFDPARLDDVIIGCAMPEAEHPSLDLAHSPPSRTAMSQVRSNSTTSITSSSLNGWVVRST